MHKPILMWSFCPAHCTGILKIQNWIGARHYERHRLGARHYERHRLSFGIP